MPTVSLQLHILYAIFALYDTNMIVMALKKYKQGHEFDPLPLLDQKCKFFHTLFVITKQFAQ